MGLGRRKRAVLLAWNTAQLLVVEAALGVRRVWRALGLVWCCCRCCCRCRCAASGLGLHALLLVAFPRVPCVLGRDATVARVLLLLLLVVLLLLLAQERRHEVAVGRHLVVVWRGRMVHCARDNDSRGTRAGSGTRKFAFLGSTSLM